MNSRSFFAKSVLSLIHAAAQLVQLDQSELYNSDFLIAIASLPILSHWVKPCISVESRTFRLYLPFAINNVRGGAIHSHRIPCYPKSR